MNSATTTLLFVMLLWSMSTFVAFWMAVRDSRVEYPGLPLGALLWRAQLLYARRLPRLATVVGLALLLLVLLPGPVRMPWQPLPSVYDTAVR